jgi:hypothetical protein
MDAGMRGVRDSRKLAAWVWWSREDSGYLTRKEKDKPVELTVKVGWRKKKGELAKGKRYMWSGFLHTHRSSTVLTSRWWR